MAGHTAAFNSGQAYINPIAGYQPSDKDEASTAKYYGFVDGNANWYIMKWDTSADTFRYVFGTTGYTTAWSNRASETYTYFFA